MLHTIILTLGVIITFSETPAIDCGFSDYVGACFIPSQNRIVLGYQDLEHLFPHEIAHATGFDEDEEIVEFLKDYPALREYPIEIYDTELKQSKEKVADWFAYYYQSKSWNDPESFDPELKELFDRKIKELID